MKKQLAFKSLWDRAPNGFKGTEKNRAIPKLKLASVENATDGKLTKDHQKSLLETLKDPKETAAYLNAALEEGDNELFLLALKTLLKPLVNINLDRP